MRFGFLDVGLIAFAVYILSPWIDGVLGFAASPIRRVLGIIH